MQTRVEITIALGIDIVSCHDISIFIVITVVAASRAHHHESVFAIEVLSDIVGDAHLKCDSLGVDIIRHGNQRAELQFAEPTIPIARGEWR